MRPVSPHAFVAHLLDGVGLRLGEVPGEGGGVVVLRHRQRVAGVVQLIPQGRQQVLLDVGEAIEFVQGLQRQVEQIPLEFEIVGGEFADMTARHRGDPQPSGSPTSTSGPTTSRNPCRKLSINSGRSPTAASSQLMPTLAVPL